MIAITFAAHPDPDAPLCLPVAKGTPLDAVLPAAFRARGQVAAGRAFKGDIGEVADFHVEADDGLRRIVVFGSGDGDSFERAGAALVERYLTQGETSLVVDLSAIAADRRADCAAAFALGARLRSQRQDRHRSVPEDEQPSLASLQLAVGEAVEAAMNAWTPLNAVCQGVALTRDLVTEPGNLLYPEAFVDRCRDLADLGIEIEALDPSAMAALGMGALLAVGQGSARPPRLLSLTWKGGEAGDETIALVGKGVTFDTGGISIKPSTGMEAMKWDMAGAAAVVGVMKTLALRKARVNVVGVCALAENMPDGAAMRPGDVVRSLSGKTIEVINTDAEGRLVLADAVTWVQRTHGVKQVIDVATLTGAVMIGLGREFAGLFTPDDALARDLAEAGAATGERLWRLPLDPALDKMLVSTIADVKNIGPPEAGASTAAHFIGRFIEDGVRWAHLDIAGMAWSDKPSALSAAGATGFGVRLLDRFLRLKAQPLRNRPRP